MLDAYIIEHIRRERERAHREGAQVPLHIEPPRPTPAPRRHDEREEENGERGSVVIDFLV